MRCISLLLVFFLINNSLFSQEESNVIFDNSYEPVGEINPKHTFNLVVGLPNGLRNKPFANIMRGIVELNPYYQYYFPNSLVVGVGARYMHFNLNQAKVTEPMSGVMHSIGGFVKLGYEKFYSTRFAMDFSVKVGYLENQFNTSLNKKMRGGAYRFDSGFVEPTVGLILSATENSAYRLTFGYTIQGYIFRPFQLGTMMNGGWDPSEYTKSTGIFTLGLGYTYYFGK